MITPRTQSERSMAVVDVVVAVAVADGDHSGHGNGNDPLWRTNHESRNCSLAS
jgi:hypothetical protein